VSADRQTYQSKSEAAVRQSPLVEAWGVTFEAVAGQ
jgi:hypothetical protein